MCDSDVSLGRRQDSAAVCLSDNLITVLFNETLHLPHIFSDLFPDQTSHLKNYQIIVPQLVLKRWERHVDRSHTQVEFINTHSLNALG